MTKTLEKYVEYFHERIHEYYLKDWQVHLQVERRVNELPSRLVVDEKERCAYLMLNELVLENQWADIVIDRPLRNLCAYLFECETPRLYVRHFEENDYEDYKELVMQSDLRMWEGNKVIQEEAEVGKYLHKDTTDPFKFALYEKKLRKVIGHISIHPTSSRSVPTQSMGYGLSRLYHRQGYMSEAASAMLQFCFEGLQAQIVEASYFDGNKGSEGVIRKLGMQYEGYRRYGYWDPNQGAMHIHVNSITREEYYRKKNFHKFS